MVSTPIKFSITDATKRSKSIEKWLRGIDLEVGSLPLNFISYCAVFRLNNPKTPTFSVFDGF